MLLLPANVDELLVTFTFARVCLKGRQVHLGVVQDTGQREYNLNWAKATKVSVDKVAKHDDHVWRLEDCVRTSGLVRWRHTKVLK